MMHLLFGKSYTAKSQHNKIKEYTFANCIMGVYIKSYKT